MKMEAIRNFGRRILSLFTICTCYAEEKLKRKEEQLLFQVERIQHNMHFCEQYAAEIETQLNARNDNPTASLNARKWFRVKRQIVKDNWDTLMWDDGNISSSKPFLVHLEEGDILNMLNDPSWRKLKIWADVVNRTTKRMLRLKKRMQKRSRFKQVLLCKCCCSAIY